MIYVDIDGTLTFDGENPWGKPNLKLIAKVQALIINGEHVVIWSARGQKYAKKFCSKYNLNPDFILAKPTIIVDDCESIRKEGLILHYTPEQFLNFDG